MKVLKLSKGQRGPFSTTLKAEGERIPKVGTAKAGSTAPCVEGGTGADPPGAEALRGKDYLETLEIDAMSLDLTEMLRF